MDGPAADLGAAEGLVADLPAADLPLIDAPATTPDMGAPISAPNKTWSWVPFAQARCANNSTTGIGVNLNSASTKVLIFLQGGGACWDAATCVTKPQAVNLDGYNQVKFKYAAAKHFNKGVLNRTNAVNPYQAWNYVFIPYCTGDLHAGSKYSALSKQHHVGHLNVTEYLKRVVPTFSGATQVLLAGSSAGGIGALLNYHQVQQAFGPVPVDALDDSGPLMDGQYLKPKLQNAWQAAWNLAKAKPAGCSKCTAGNIHAIQPYLAATYPKRRFGLIVAGGDLVLRGYYGQGYTPPALLMPLVDFQNGLNHLADTVLAPHKNFRVYYIASNKHVFLDNTALALTQVKGVKLVDWIAGLSSGAPGWKNVRP
jgi:hypothetical protein